MSRGTGAWLAGKVPWMLAVSFVLLLFCVAVWSFHSDLAKHGWRSFLLSAACGLVSGIVAVFVIGGAFGRRFTVLRSECRQVAQLVVISLSWIVLIFVVAAVMRRAGIMNWELLPATGMFVASLILLLILLIGFVPALVLWVKLRRRLVN